MLNKSEVLYFENCIEKLNEKGKNALLDIVYMSKKELVLSIHTYKISRLEGKDKRWHTYIKAEGQKRPKEIKAPTEKGIIDYLATFYGIEGMTFARLFEEWLEYKKTVTSCSGTIRRHEQHFRRYFVKKPSKLLTMKISKIDKLTLQSECNRIVKDYNMSRKEWINVKGIIRGMFEYAYDKDMISKNPVDRMKITVKYRQVEKPKSSTQVYKTPEYENILAYLDRMYAETNDSAFLAVEFQFFTGMRVGELVALRWEDVDLNSLELHIRSEESNQPYQDKDGKWHDRCVVVPHTKSYRDRTIQLLPKAVSVIRKLSGESTFLFERSGKRITERQVNYVLEKYAQRMGLVTKSSHKIRKTYASMLDAAGLPLDVIQRDLGHKDAKTTLTYLYNPLPDEATYNLKAQAI